jgi:outer membrane protein assembly factor BamB
MRYSKMFTIVLSFLVLLAITGCQNWPQFRYGPEHTGYNDVEFRLNKSNVSALKLYYSAQVTGYGGPAVSGVVLYMGSDDAHHTLSAFSELDLSFLWSVSVGSRVSDTPAVCSTCTAHGLVFFGSWDKKVYAVDIQTHQIVWSYLTGNIITSSPTVANGNVYIGSEDQYLYGFVAATGQPLTGFPVKTNGPIFSTPAVAGNNVYVESWDYNLYAFNASTGGLPLWKVNIIGLDSSPSIDVVHGVVYAGGNRYLWAFDTSGNLLWKAPVLDQYGADSSSPAVANGLVYITSTSPLGNGHIYAFDTTNNGSAVWSRALPLPGDVTVANGVVYVGSGGSNTTHSHIYALNAMTGATLWTSPNNINVGGQEYSNVTVVNSVVYGVGGGHVYEFGL